MASKARLPLAQAAQQAEQARTESQRPHVLDAALICLVAGLWAWHLADVLGWPALVLAVAFLGAGAGMAGVALSEWRCRHG